MNKEISADIFQWFNKHCLDILNDGCCDLLDLEWDLKYSDIDALADEVSDYLVVKLDYDEDVVEEYRDQIEYDLDKLVDETLSNIKHGDIVGLEFARTKSDWIDKYANPDEYSASLVA